ncbi:MAG: GNAT family N-acetyltransferase [Jatrophihabitantaceae bacterium]
MGPGTRPAAGAAVLRRAQRRLGRGRVTHGLSLRGCDARPDDAPAGRTGRAAGERPGAVQPGGRGRRRAGLARVHAAAARRPGRRGDHAAGDPAAGRAGAGRGRRRAQRRLGVTGQAHSPDQVRRECDRAGLDWLVGAGAPFSMVDVATGEVAGSIRLRLAGPPGVGGIGYVVHPRFRGRRYTTRALRLLSAWAFEHGGYARLELGAKIGNVASQRAALAAGFQPDGLRAARLRNPDGSFSDEARFALVNPAVVRR